MLILLLRRFPILLLIWTEIIRLYHNGWIIWIASFMTTVSWYCIKIIAMFTSSIFGGWNAFACLFLTFASRARVTFIKVTLGSTCFPSCLMSSRGTRSTEIEAWLNFCLNIGIYMATSIAQPWYHHQAIPLLIWLGDAGILVWFLGVWSLMVNGCSRSLCLNQLLVWFRVIVVIRHVAG